VEWKRWKYHYYQIISEFGYDTQKDYNSALILNNFLKKKRNFKSPNVLKDKIRDKIIFIFGCGPSLPNHLKLLKTSNLILKNFTCIAADGATSALMQCDILPNIIMTDLDGRVADQILANKYGTIVIIHAHGDNLGQIHHNFSNFQGELMGSTQNKPLSHVFNFGGFTDGDRCVFLAAQMKASIIILFGFDFGKIVGKFSKPYLDNDKEADEIKLKKLYWAQKLLSELSYNTKSLLIKVDGDQVKLGKIQNLEFADLIKFLEMNPHKTTGAKSEDTE
jgi:2-amino-4-hydroxy-6-hydroxymethyldihydropteridine diphosphokinase